MAWAGPRRSRPARRSAPRPTRAATPARWRCWRCWRASLAPRAWGPRPWSRPRTRPKPPSAPPARAPAPAAALGAPVELPDARRLIVLAGLGPNAVTAREGALKLREAARLPAEG